MRVALHDDLATELGEGEADGLVALGRTVGEKPRPLGSPRIGRHRLGLLERSRGRAHVDAVDDHRNVERERLPAERLEQPGVGPRPTLVTGYVEAPGSALGVPAKGLEIGGGVVVGGPVLGRRLRLQELYPVDRPVGRRGDHRSARG